MIDNTIDDTPPAGLVEAQRLAICVAETIAAEVVPGECEREVRDRADKLVLELGGEGVWTPTTVGHPPGDMRVLTMASMFASTRHLEEYARVVLHHQGLSPEPVCTIPLVAAAAVIQLN